MKTRTSCLLHACIATAVVGTAAIIAGQPPSPTSPTSPPAIPSIPATPLTPPPDDRGQPKADPATDEQKMMQDWLALAKPGQPHALLKSLEGSYTTVTKIWMDPKAAPMETTGTATFKTVLGGRFLQQDFTGTMMGQPMSGLGLMGYDNYRHQYTSTWADNLGTAIYTMTGSISQDGKTITQFGTMDEPTTKQIGKNVKWVTRLIDTDKLVFESWEVETGEPMKVFAIEYTRVK